jgi:hypothetical protein
LRSIYIISVSEDVSCECLARRTCAPLKLAIQLTNHLFAITGTNVAAGYWSGIESNCSVICASLPTLRPLFSRFFPGLIGTSSNGVSTVQSVGNAPVTGVVRQIEGNEQSHSLESLSTEPESKARYFHDIESGKIKEAIFLEHESEQVCDTSDGASEWKLVEPGSAF